MTDFAIRDSCRLCHSTDLEELLRLNPTPLANSYPQQPIGVVKNDGEVVSVNAQDRYPLFLVGCRHCGHVQLPVVVDPRLLFPADYAYASGTSPVFRAHLADLALTIASMHGGRSIMAPSPLVLDVACNDGTLVYALHDVGMRACGVDPAAPGNDDLFRAFFTEDWARRARFSGQVSCVTALNVAAHVADLDDFVRGVRTILEPGGLFLVEVGYLRDVVDGKRFSPIYHEHLDVHHIAPLVGFFARHGMTLTDAERIDSQGGSIRLFVRNAPDQEQSARLRDLLAEEDRDALWQGVRALSRSVDAAREQLAANAPLVCYGAPAKLTTLLHATRQTDAVEYVVDANPRKQGKFLPGTSIPILAPSVLYERRPKRILVTAWNFAESIRGQHPELDCEWLVSEG